MHISEKFSESEQKRLMSLIERINDEAGLREVFTFVKLAETAEEVATKILDSDQQW